jgi:NAD(P)-dependent dehydrogenase (short-subunit alcohol dehydrogenase family)
MSKTWFITGSASGIGAAVAKAALAAGDNVVATDRDTERLERAFTEQGEKLLRATLDITDEPQAVAAVQAAVARFGRIDVLVNNAGYGQFGPFEENDAPAIEKQFATNVFGTFHVTRAVLPVLRRQRAGHVFILSSLGGFAGVPNASIYTSTKFALEGFSESLVFEVAEFGIKVTLVEPGAFRTDFLNGDVLRYGTRTIDDYASFTAAARATVEKRNGRELGDPTKLAEALILLAGLENPPLHFVAGPDAFDKMTTKLKAVSDEVAAWRDLSLSTDFEHSIARRS